MENKHYKSGLVTGIKPTTKRWQGKPLAPMGEREPVGSGVGHGWRNPAASRGLLRRLVEVVNTQEEYESLERELQALQALCPSYSKICKEVNETMEFDTQCKLDEYLGLLEQIKQKTSDERTAVSILQEISKDRRSAGIREERESRGAEPATEKQKQFMKKLNIRFPATVTKHEASSLIDEELARNGE